MILDHLKEIAERLIQVPAIRHTHGLVTRTYLEVFASNRLLATIHSFLMFHTFNREQFSVLRGRRNYRRSLSAQTGQSPELRRSIHRIEKGLTMRPARNTFADGYILEAVDQYCRSLRADQRNRSSIKSNELQWAHDVLSKYFDTVTSTATTEKAHTLFKNTLQSGSSPSLMAPYPSKSRPACTIKHDEFHRLCTRRRSIRWFQSKPVERSIIDKAVASAGLSPTACNRQPYEFLIYDDPELVRRVAAVPFGAKGYVEQIPALAVIVGHLENYASPRDRHAIYIDSSLAAMSFLLALETLGLSSTIINWPDFEPLEIHMQRLLGLDVCQRVTMLIAFGYPDPDGLVPFSEKKHIDNFRSYNRREGKLGQ